MNQSQIGKILVVDDELELRSFLVESLISQGYETVDAGSGEEALRTLRAEAFDVVLTDLMMPGMNGIKLVKAALQIDPQLVCIVMTGQGTIQTAVDALKVGSFDFVLKPFQLQTLTPIIERAMSVRQMRVENLQLRETVAIYELAQTIALTLDTETVLNKLVEAVLKQTDADEVAVLLPAEEGRDELCVAAVRGAIRGAPPEITSSISIPMKVANRVIGTININAVNRVRPFTRAQKKILTVLAGTAAAALESASLYTKVRRAEENYRAIFENAVEGIFQETAERKFINVNPPMARILGYDSPEELMAAFNRIDAPLYADPSLADEVTRTLEQCGVVRGFQFEAYRKDQKRIWLSLNLRLVRDRDGKTLFREGTIEDITEQKRLEDHLRQSQKMEAIGQLAGGVAHDFNNLLTAINGYSSLALQRANPNERLKGYLEEIRKAGERATNLTRQLLAFGRKQMLKPVALNLNDVVSDMNKMLRRLIGENIRFEVKLDPSVSKIKADAGQIEQVLVNLVINSRDAMPQGGSLTIETSNVDVDHEYVSKHLGVAAGAYVMLAISDTGCGMSTETRARIFEPFFTTKDKGKGTGLGLPTVYGIVKQSGGDVWVYSEPGKGTTFKVYLPQLSDHEGTSETEAAETTAARGSDPVALAKKVREVLDLNGFDRSPPERIPKHD
jgi:PAS domain S-box-containing protein